MRGALLQPTALLALPVQVVVNDLILRQGTVGAECQQVDVGVPADGNDAGVVRPELPGCLLMGLQGSAQLQWAAGDQPEQNALGVYAADQWAGQQVGEV